MLVDYKLATDLCTDHPRFRVVYLNDNSIMYFHKNIKTANAARVEKFAGEEGDEGGRAGVDLGIFLTSSKPDPRQVKGV